jgi:hypothetical protein
MPDAQCTNIERLKAAGALDDWGRLYALYPGW